MLPPEADKKVGDLVTDAQDTAGGNRDAGSVVDGVSSSSRRPERAAARREQREQRRERLRDLEPLTRKRHAAEIHEIDYESAGLGDLGSPQGYVRRQVEGWTKRYYNARTDEVASIESLADWLHQNLPADSERPALIHNDYKYDNLVLAPDDLARVIAVLDWEMATIGDPLMDFGTSLGYWVESTDPEDWQRYGFGLTMVPGSFTRTELLEHYARRSGRRIEDPVFYFVYGLLKIAVIVQQIYFRYQKGLTRDPRFAQLGALVKACGILGWRAIERKRVDGLG